jgi:hydrogenase-4 membrane subunit HyfE
MAGKSPASRTRLKKMLALLRCTVMSLGIVVLITVAFPQNAHAYLDPGSASYIFQVAVASILAGLFFFKSIFRKIRGLFIKSKEKDDSIDEQ